jgi:hypothetical protein
MKDWLWDWLPVILFPLFIVGIVGGFSYWIYSEERDCDDAVAACGLYRGDRIRSVLDGTPGMITGTSCGSVRVRFSASASRTDVSLLGSDGVIEREPYANVWMGCYEVEPE